jgi:hypothetical protein
MKVSPGAWADMIVLKLINPNSQLQIEGLNHIYSRSESVNCNILQSIWNLHDGEHFAGTHRDTMLTKEIKIDNLTQDENKLFWQLIQYKRDDLDVKKSVTNLLVDPVFVQCFNTFLPSLAVITLNFREQLVLGIVNMYPESPNKTRFCLDSYLDFEFTWWQKLLKFPKVANLMRDRLIFEDISILENLYPTFNHKITLKNDTPAELAMSYLQT